MEKINLDILTKDDKNKNIKNYEIPKINKSNKSNNLVQTYLNNKEKELLDLFCKKNNLTKSSAVKEIIRAFFKMDE